MTIPVTKWIKENVSTDDAPAAVGPYSQAVCAGPFVFVSGQLGLVPGTRQFAGETIAEQTEQAMENIAAILDAACSSLEQVLKVTVYFEDLSDFSKFNEVYAGYFKDDPPARAALEASDLPMDALVEIDVIALRD
ncbi:MAG: Rid family detoxifying hydrolase [Thermoplasmatota archaeon]